MGAQTCGPSEDLLGYKLSLGQPGHVRACLPIQAAPKGKQREGRAKRTVARVLTLVNTGRLLAFHF